MVHVLCSLARNPDGTLVRPTSYEINAAETFTLFLAAGAVAIVILTLAIASIRRGKSIPAAGFAGLSLFLMAVHPLWTVSTNGGDCGTTQVLASWVVLIMQSLMVAAQLLHQCLRRRPDPERLDYGEPEG